jgi:hypothetical protein
MEAASVCLHRHHGSPCSGAITLDSGPPAEVEFNWDTPSPAVHRANANAIDATEAGAYGICLASVDHRLGLIAIRRAQALTGGDYYLVPADAEIPGDPDLDLDRDDLALLEVSGIDRDTDSTMEGRLSEKVAQVRARGFSGRAFAGVVGFRGARVWVEEA